MKNDSRLTDAAMRARALSRWEGEGGALTPTDADASIDESEMRILARLGAALLGDWAQLSPALQERIIHRARTVGGAADHARVKAQLAQFMRECTDEEKKG